MKNEKQPSLLEMMEAAIDEPIPEHHKVIIEHLEKGDAISMPRQFGRKTLNDNLSKVIRDLEVKMLPSSRRDRNEPPQKALTQEERLVYADFLDSTNQPLGAKAFRNYVEPVKVEKKRKERKK